MDTWAELQNFEELCLLRYSKVYRKSIDFSETCLSEMSVGFEQTALRCIPQDIILHDHLCENIESCIHKFSC